MEESVEQNYIYERVSSMPHAGTDRIVSSSQVKAFSFYDWLIFPFSTCADLRPFFLAQAHKSDTQIHTDKHRYFAKVIIIIELINI